MPHFACSTYDVMPTTGRFELVAIIGLVQRDRDHRTRPSSFTITLLPFTIATGVGRCPYAGRWESRTAAGRLTPAELTLPTFAHFQGVLCVFPRSRGACRRAHDRRGAPLFAPSDHPRRRHDRPEAAEERQGARRRRRRPLARQRCSTSRRPGVGTLGIVDFDAVDESNLQRQIIHGQSDVGTLEGRVRAKDVDRGSQPVRRPWCCTRSASTPTNVDGDLRASTT